MPFVSSDGIHQLHIFIFVLAIFHVLYCILTMALGGAKVRIRQDNKRHLSIVHKVRNCIETEIVGNLCLDEKLETLGE